MAFQKSGFILYYTRESIDLSNKHFCFRNTTQIAISHLGPIGQHLPLLYDHSKSQDDYPTARQEAEQLLSGLCGEGAPPAVGPEAPSVFSQLIHKLRKVNAGDLTALYTKIQRGDCDNAK